MRNRELVLVAAALGLISPTVAFGAESPGPLERTGHRIVRAWATQAQAPAHVPDKDSGANGPLIGAVAGGTALGATMGTLCYSFPGGNCGMVTLGSAAAGAGIGALIGWAVDALHD